VNPCLESGDKGLKLPGISEKSLFAVMSGPDLGLEAIALSPGETMAAATRAKAMTMSSSGVPSI